MNSVPWKERGVDGRERKGEKDRERRVERE